MAKQLIGITGASSGLGKALAYEFASKGNDLVLIARRENLLKEMQKDLTAKHKVKVTYLLCDLSKREQYHELAEKLAGHKIDMFINNAGAGQGGERLRLDENQTDDMIVLLINSLTYLSQAIGKQMAKRGGGTIVNIASGLAYAPYAPGFAVYSAAKKYVFDISRAMNYENEKLNNKVKVVSVQPGAIATEFQAKIATADDKNILNNMDFGDANAFAKDTVAQLASGKTVIDSGPMIDACRPGPKNPEKKIVDLMWSFSGGR